MVYEGFCPPLRGPDVTRSKPTRVQRDEQLVAAVAHHAAGRLLEAARLYRAVLERRPREPNALDGLGQAMGALGYPDEGIRLIRQAIGAWGSEAAFHVNLANLLRAKGEFDEAMREYEKASWLDPKNPDVPYLIASALEQFNRLPEAAAAVEKALKLDPTHGAARVLSVKIRLRRHGDAALSEARQELETLLSREHPGHVRRFAYRILGDVRERFGDPVAAFEAYSLSAEAAREGAVPPDSAREAFLHDVDSYPSRISHELLQQWGGVKFDDGLPAPALLVGFPRSGTTMTERILDAHPDIDSLDERPIFDRLASEMTRLLGPAASGQSEADRVRLLSDEHVRTLRALYWQNVREHLGDRDARRIVLDKMPLQTFRLAMVNRIFPDAKVLFAIRDPRDVCLSCFIQRFMATIEMSFFLTLDGTATLYERIMRSWLEMKERLTLDILVIRYEHTVSDLASEAERMLAFLGVPWSDEVLRFHESARDHRVSTPSYEAVTSSVRTDAVGRWKKFREQIEPIIPRLEPFVSEFGYPQSSAESV